MYGVTLAHFIFENNLREILLCFTLSLQLKKTPRNPPLSLSLFSDCCTTQLKRDPRRAAGDIYKCSRRRRSLPPPSPPGFPFGAKPRRASRRPPACSLLFPPGGRGETLHTNSGAPGRRGESTALPRGVLPPPAPPPPSRSPNFHSLLASPGGPPLVIFSPPPPSLAGPGRAAAQPVSAARGAAGGAGEARPHSPYIGRRVGRSRLRGSGARRRRRRQTGGGSSRRGAAAPEHFRRAPCGEEESRPAGGGAILLFQRRGSGCEGRSRRAASLLRFLRRFPRCQRAEGPGCSVPAPPSSGAAGKGRGAKPS